MKSSVIGNPCSATFSQADLTWAETKISFNPNSVVNYFDLIKCRNTLSTDQMSVRGKVPLETTSRNFELYRAFRDCLEPRTRAFPEAGIWRADLISYSGEWLPSGEPCRSIGHWNPPEQLEVFEVLLGNVIMLVLSPLGDIEVIKCFPGTAWRIPKGSFHLTYALRPSLVINIYNAGIQSHEEDKYHRKTIPDAFLQVINADASVVFRKEAPGAKRPVDQYPCVACASSPHSLRSLHFLDDIAFSDALQEFEK